jgi:hypothetical protein
VSLHFDLMVNRTTIGYMEIQRIDNTGVTKLPDDVVSTYMVRVNGAEKGTVRHRYGDGAWALLRTALDELMEDL